MAFGIFDQQHKRTVDGSPYMLERLLGGQVFESAQAAQNGLARLRQNRLYNWRRMGVRPLRAGDLERTVRPDTTYQPARSVGQAGGGHE